MSWPEPVRPISLHVSDADRASSYSRLLSFECAHILSRLGSDVRVFDTVGLPIKDDVQLEHHKVQELRGLSN